MKKAEILATLKIQAETNLKLQQADLSNRSEQEAISRTISRRLAAAQKTNPAAYKKAVTEYNAFIEEAMNTIYTLYAK